MDLAKQISLVDGMPPILPSNVTPADIAAWRAQFDKLGIEVVRSEIANGHYQSNSQLLKTAIDWLAQKREEELARNEASQALQSRIARSARNAAWVAAIAAIIAAIAAIITIVVELKK